MKLFQDTNKITDLRPLYDAEGHRLYGTDGRPLYGDASGYDTLRYDNGTIHFYGVADAEKTCDYTRKGQIVKEDTTTLEDNMMSHGVVHTTNDLRIDAASGWSATYAAAKSQANTWLNELMDKANTNEIDILQLVEAGKFSLRSVPSKIYNGYAITYYGSRFTSSIIITERGDARHSTNSQGETTGADASADIYDSRRVAAMLWCFPCCAPGCKLKITIKSYASVRCYYREALWRGDVYPEFTPDSYIIKAYPVDAAWTNNLGPAIPIDRANVQNIAVPFPYRFANSSSFNTTNWESEIELTVPPSRILVAVIDATQFFPWVNSAVRAFAGYDRTSAGTEYFQRYRSINIDLWCQNATIGSSTAKPVAP